jgi:hypothetical protein
LPADRRAIHEITILPSFDRSAWPTKAGRMAAGNPFGFAGFARSSRTATGPASSALRSSGESRSATIATRSGTLDLSWAPAWTSILTGGAGVAT